MRQFTNKGQVYRKGLGVPVSYFTVSNSDKNVTIWVPREKWSKFRFFRKLPGGDNNAAGNKNTVLGQRDSKWWRNGERWEWDVAAIGNGAGNWDSFGDSGTSRRSQRSSHFRRGRFRPSNLFSLASGHARTLRLARFRRAISLGGDLSRIFSYLNNFSAVLVFKTQHATQGKEAATHYCTDLPTHHPLAR